MKILFSLISREICNIGAVKVQYCSKQCQELAWGEHHREECDQVIFLPRRAQICGILNSNHIVVLSLLLCSLPVL